MCALNTFNRFLIEDNLRYFSIKKNNTAPKPNAFIIIIIIIVIIIIIIIIISVIIYTWI